MAVAPLLAFSYDDINRADKRYLEYRAGTTGDVVNSQSVSKGLAAYSSASMALCIVSLIASLVVRMAFYYTDKLTFDSALAIRKRLILFELCSVLPLVTALIVVTFSYYWSGWVVYSENLVSVPSWYCIGLVVIACLVLIVFYGGYVALYIHRNGKPAAPSETNKDELLERIAACMVEYASNRASKSGTPSTSI